MKQIKRLSLLMCILILCSSHELFLKSDSHFLQPYSTGQLYLFNGTFDVSENEITRDRIIDAVILGPEYDFKPQDRNYYGKEKVTYLNYTIGKEGSCVAGISTLPRILEMSANDFNNYLEHEGLHQTIKERKSNGLYDLKAKERYSKHVKALLQVGEHTSMHVMKPLGYPIEFVPMNNPYEVNLGDAIAFKLLRNGKPLPNQTVHYSTSMPGKDAHENENSTTTNKNGIFTIRPNKNGKWYVASIHMERKRNDVVDYESNWATLTFEVK